MGTELVRSCIKEDDLDFPAIPPGFESFTSFKLKRAENSENENSCAVSSNLSEQPVPIQVEPDDKAGKISRSLRRRPWINYSQFDEACDDECNSEQLDQNFPVKPSLPKGVIRGCPACQNCQKVVARWHPEAACRPVLEDVPVFYPNEEEFEDTLTYIEKIRPKAEPYGICRIVPPSSWKPPCPLKEKDIWEKSKFATRVQRVDKLQNRDASRKMSNDNLMRKKRRRCSRMGVENGAGSVNIFEHGETVFGFEPGPEFTLDSFERYADDFKAQYFRRTENSTGPSEKWDPPVEIIESEYWRVVEKPTEEIEVLYGADLETGIFGSGFPKDSGQVCASSDEQYVKSGWNLNNLPLLPGSVLSYENASISGVQVPWLYVGMCFSSFCWHVEDHHLYSLNYMHFGAPKMWYGVPGKDAMRLEEAMRKHLPDLFEEQPDLLHKLITQLSPTILKSEGVPVYRCIQNAGEFVLTFPRAYHAGFNCGFNCAEAVNVAPVDWFPYGQNAVELYREQGRKTTISHDKLLLGAAREAVKAHWEINLLRKNTVENLKWKSVCGKDGVLAKSLKARVEKERASREHFCKSSKTMKMESNFDATRERECCLCFFDLHLSAAGCHCSPDRFSCLNHSKLWCACAPSEKYFLFRYDISELNLLVEAVEGKLSAIYRWAKLDLGLALSDCLSKNNKEVAGLMDSFSEHPEEKSQCRTTSLAPLNMKKEEGIENKPADLSSDISKMPNIQTDKRSDVVLALQATRVSPIKISLQLKLKNGKIKFKKEGNKLSASLVDGPDQKGVLCDQSSTEMEPTLGKSSHGHSDIICLDDEDDQLHEVPAYQTKGTNFPDCSSISKAVDCSGHKLNLSDLANAALAAEGNLSLTPPEEKDTHLSCSETPKDDKCDTPSASIEHNISRQQASTDSSSNIDRDGQRSNPESLPQNIATAPVVQLSNKVRDETVVHKGEVDLRIFPGSPSCSQNGLEKNYRPKGLRIAKVVRRINCCVEPLELGVVLSGNSWSNCQAIFPKGFKSRVRYIDFSDPTNMCYYISEIVDGGSKGPLFMVYLEHCSTEVFVHVTPKRCWEMVRERVNQEITKQHKLRKPMLPPLQPPGSLDGFEMFGFTSPSIVQAIEALDKNCVCTEYWKSRPLAKMSRCFQYREARQNIHSISEEANRAAGVDEVLRSLLKKANPEELKSLNELLSRERPAVDSSLVSRLLNEEIQSRPR